MHTRDILEQSWKVLPVPHDRAGRPEGYEILDEMGEEGGLLFRIYRAIRSRAALGTGAVAATRDEVVADAVTRADDELWDALREVTCVYDPACAPRQISAAAERIATILAQRSQLRSAAAFRRAAAAITPSDALASYRAGRAMRETGDYSEAEVWLDRAIVLARQQRAWKAYVLSYIAYGRLHQERGANPRAERHYMRALRRAKRQGLSYEAAMSAHDLMVIELNRADYQRALEYTRIAIVGYGRNSVGMFRLAHDIGWQYLQMGYFRESAEIFRAISNLADDPTLSLASRANLCRAYGAMGDDLRYRQLREEVLEEAHRAPSLHADLLIEVAIGARSLGDYEVSEADASRALQVAEAAAHHRSVFRANALLDSLRRPSPNSAVSGLSGALFIPVQEVVEALVTT